MTPPSDAGESGAVTAERPVAPPEPSVDRKAAFAAGPPGVSRKAIGIGLAIMAAVAISGTLLEHVMSSGGPAPNATARATGRAIQVLHVPAKHLPGGASVVNFLGVEALARHSAPPLRLPSNRGGELSLASLRGKAVALSFLDAPCNDACPVIGAELAAADQRLGAAAASVEFVIVNADPDATAWQAAPPALSRTGLQGLANVAFLTGPIGRLNPIWKRYGVGIQVSSTGQVAHSNLIYFIDPKGRLAYRATPYANEARNGTYHLAPALEQRWAGGIATYLDSLVPAASSHR
ncbi:MAG: SCO family protein [Actinomycetota bacterium]|nr:SCO family protein [Actinomycetota bacterium]